MIHARLLVGFILVELLPIIGIGNNPLTASFSQQLQH